MNKWNSVAEKLPKCGQDVLVYGVWNQVDVMSLAEDEEEGEYVWVDHLGYCCSVHEITCWLTLPEPPGVTDINVGSKEEG